jgi:asparagine synthase (glutamine-hydrolysing)
MSMAASIEVRVPLLDEDLLEEMLSLPVSLKIKGTTRKFVLKKSMEGRLPHNVLWRKKAGFGAPIQSWLQSGLKALADEFLGESYLRAQNIFNPRMIQRLRFSEAQKDDYYANHIWQLLTFQLWYDVFVHARDARPSPAFT